ncbi:cell division protein FtsK [Streptomyces sp. NPDC003300]|uniref:cell division protein FtsK n=1 Tax=unclassified Streptomyces TaxID=2593676 RepID=UPI0033B52C67
MVDILTKRAAPAGTATVERDPEAVVMVDGPQPTGPGFLARAMGAKRHDLLPAWLTSRTEFATAAKWAGGYSAHLAGYHALRVLPYAGRLALRAPAGAAKFINGTMRWVSDAEGMPVRADAVLREDAGDYLKLSRQRDNRVKLRSILFGLACLIGLPTALALWILAPTWLLAVAGTAVTLALGWYGTPSDRPIVTHAVDVPDTPKLTGDMVLTALASLGIAPVNQAVAKGGRALVSTAPITRDGPGWRAEGDLPLGVTVADVIDKRDRLASALRRPLGTVWPEGDPATHTGHLILWVGDQDMNKAKQPAWPLAKSGSVDLFKPVGFGTDQRGRWVELTMMYIAGIIGAIPRMGKTFLLRLLLLIAALDPRAELHTYDLKGTGDLDTVGDAVAHRHRAGEEIEDIEHAIADMRGLREELRRRAKMIRSLPRDICPESKVTSELASKRSLGLHPIVVGVDECQVWFEHPTYGAEFEEICTDLVKRGPATGIVLLLATQRPDSKSLPTGISANASTRFCMKVMGQIENDMVLGTGAYKRGVRATMFAWADKGIHYFVGEGSDARIVRSVYADAVISERIAARARASRDKAGTLSGHALGESPEAVTGPSYDLLADLLAVIAPDETKVWSETVVARLGELRPDVYGGWEPDQLAYVLKPHGITTGQVWGKTDDGKGANRRGITRAHITTAIAERDKKRDAG